MQESIKHQTSKSKWVIAFQFPWISAERNQNEKDIEDGLVFWSFVPIFMPMVLVFLNILHSPSLQQTHIANVQHSIHLEALPFRQITLCFYRVCSRRSIMALVAFIISYLHDLANSMWWSGLGTTYQTGGLVQFAQLGSDEWGYLAPQERLHGHRQAEVLQSAVLVKVKVIVVVVRSVAVVVCL